MNTDGKVHLTDVAGFALFFCLALCTLFPQPSLADSQSSIIVRVVDAKTNAPVRFVRILVSGKFVGAHVGYTDERGHAEFHVGDARSVNIELYSPEYREVATQLKIDMNRQYDVIVKLIPRSQPKTIAVIRATSKPLNNFATSGISSPGAIASSSLFDSLLSMPGISTRNGGVSVDGLAPGATRLSVDGLPIGTGGDTPFLSSLGLDLFDSVSVRRLGSSQGAGVNLETGDPTIAFSQHGRIQIGRAGSTNARFQTTGTSGMVGFIFRHVQRNDVGALDGLRFLDQSALTYSHNDATTGTGNLYKIRVPINAYQHVLAEYSSLSGSGSQSCAIASGGVPCGFGPGNGQRFGATEGSFTYGLNSGMTALSFAFSKTTWQNVDDFSNRFFAGQPDPYSSASSVRSSNVSAGAYGPLGRGGSQLSFHFDSQLENFDLTQFGSTNTTAIPRFSEASLYDDATVGITQVHFGLEYAESGGSHIGANLLANVPFRHASLSLEATTGGYYQAPLPQVPLTGTLDDPGSLQYDCASGRIFGSTTGSDSIPSSLSGLQASYKQNSRRVAVQLSVSTQTVANAQIPVLAPLTSLAPGTIAQLENYYSSPYVCGSPILLRPSDIVLASSRNATLRQSRATLSVAWSESKQLTLAPYLELRSSMYRDGGKWLPVIYESSMRSGAIADFHLRGTKTEIIALAQIQGRNNALGLGQFGTLDLGIAQTLRYGKLLLSLTNATAAYPERFASSAFANPLPNGITPIGIPLGAPALHVTYQFTSGAKGPEVKLDPLAALAIVGKAPTLDFSYHVARIPDGPMMHPFSPMTNSPNCGPEMVSRAVLLLDVLKKITDSNPHTISRDYRIDAQTEKSLGVHIEVHQRPTYTAFAISDISAASYFPVYSCIAQHFATVRYAAKRGLYIPSKDEYAKKNMLYFDARVGEYTLDGELPAVSGQLASVALLVRVPKEAPTNPFALSPSCPQGQRGFATEIMAELANRFGRRGNPLALTPYFSVTSHSNSRIQWWSIHFHDPIARSVLEGCGVVAGASPLDLRNAQIGGSADDLNFSTRFGLYETIP